jgi:hypothetical protein
MNSQAILTTTVADDVKYDTPTLLHLTDSVVLLFVLILLAVFIVFGNVMIIAAVFTTPRIRDQPNHRFIVR